MTHEEAVRRIYDQYFPRFRARGMMPMLERLYEAEQSGNHSTANAISAQLADFPGWNEFQAAIAATYSTTEFKKNLATYNALMDAGKGDTKETRILFMRLVHLAPPWYLDGLQDDLPDATGYLDDGTPTFSQAALAKALGVSDEDARELIEEFIAERIAAGLPVDGILIEDKLIHSVQ